jgi:hypothetical protein
MEKQSWVSGSQRYASHEQAAVPEVDDGDSVTIPMGHAELSKSLRAGLGKRVAYRSNDAPVLGKESYIAVEPGGNSSKRVLLDGGWRLG